MSVRTRLLLSVCFYFVAIQIRADALVRTQAMLASTIAEIYIDASRVRVELEIGKSDLSAFHNMLPDHLEWHMGEEARPLPQSLLKFFTEDLVISTEKRVLAGSVVSLRSRYRIARDDITGEPLSVQPDEPESVIFAVLEYTLMGRPQVISLKSPSGNKRANIGFVLYHQDVAVNDFRYLWNSIHVELDWDDPWYSQ